MILYYTSITIAYTFGSWLIGMLGTEIIKHSAFYSKISHLNFISKTSTNKVIGMNLFKWMVKHTFFKYFNQKLKFETRPTITELKVIRKEMTYSEISHLIAFLFILSVVILKLIQGQFTFSLILCVANIIFNLYPSLLQQQNKRRIDNILKR